jgi:hypothetical protein
VGDDDGYNAESNERELDSIRAEAGAELQIKNAIRGGRDRCWAKQDPEAGTQTSASPPQPTCCEPTKLLQTNHHSSQNTPSPRLQCSRIRSLAITVALTSSRACFPSVTWANLNSRPQLLGVPQFSRRAEPTFLSSSVLKNTPQLRPAPRGSPIWTQHRPLLLSFHPTAHCTHTRSTAILLPGEP